MRAARETPASLARDIVRSVAEDHGHRHPARHRAEEVSR